MRDDELVVVVIGGAGACGCELRESAGERGLPVAEWRLYDTVEAVAELADEDGSPPVDLLERADFDDADIVFLCGSVEQSVQFASRAAEEGVFAVDVMHAFSGRDDVEVIVPEVNADQVGVALDTGLVACPVPAAAALSIVLNPLEQVAPLRRLTVTCLESVSSAGAAGIEELARQTLDLLSGRDPVPSLWTQRIAFNAIPQVGEVLATGATSAEWATERQIRRLLDLPDLPIIVNTVRIPTFYGQGFFVNVETETALDAEAGSAVLRQAPGVLLHEGESASAAAPAIAEAVGSEATHVGRVREDPTVAYGLSLWVAFDGLRNGGAVNAVQIAECLIKELLARR